MVGEAGRRNLAGEQVSQDTSSREIMNLASTTIVVFCDTKIIPGTAHTKNSCTYMALGINFADACM